MINPLTAAQLAALVSSRIAHDLANPVGAIANGVELLGLTGLDGSPELSLVAESVANASLRIKLFRLAFGAAAPGQTVSAAEIAALTAPANDGRKLKIDWQLPGDLPRTEAKLAFLALMCLEKAMPWGGKARVTRAGDGLRIAAQTERLNHDADVWGYLEGDGHPPAEIAAAQVQFLLLPAEAQAQGRALRVTRHENNITFEV